MNMYGFTNVPFLVVFMYLIVELLKKFWLKSDKVRSMIPFVCAFLGCFFMLFMHHYFTDVFCLGSYIEAATLGAVSGLTATGCNQLYKQVRAFYEGEKNADEEEADLLEFKIRKVTNQIELINLQDKLNKIMEKRREENATLIMDGKTKEGDQGEETSDESTSVENDSIAVG